MDDVVIKVNHVSKDFLLPHEKITSIKSAFTHANRLGKYRKGREMQHALKDISLEIRRGEFFGIVGRNGSGKSTLLKILAGIYQPSKGKVDIRGKLVPFIELGVGFNSELTGRENVYLNGAMLGFSRREIDAMYSDIVSFAELERFMDQKLKNYSSGMQVRLAFSMATRSEADILLVDEVLAVGDVDFQRKCFQYFRQLKKSKKTVVFVSHDMSAVREYCDRAILIEKGVVAAAGSSEKVAAQYTRMFIEQAQDSEMGLETARWGNGRAKIISVRVSPQKLTNKSGDLSIIITIQANETLERPNVGYSISNAQGQLIIGTNTELQRQKIGSLQAGNRLEVVFRIPNIFTDGHYTLNAAVVTEDGVPCDWWDGAAVFDVYEEISSGLVISPKTATTIKALGPQKTNKYQ